MLEEVKNETVWSWSRLNSYDMAEKCEGCYYNFFLQYYKGDRGEGNFFSSYGTLVHETIEKLHNNELFAWDLEKELMNGWKKLGHKPPFPRMGKSYEEALFEFFKEGCYNYIFDQYQILEAEEEKLFEVDGIKIKGYPDLVAQHNTYNLVIGDYKTSKKYEGEKLHHNIMQLYLYSIPIKEKYGKYPDYLVYIFPREKGKKEFAYPFKLEDLERTKAWVKRTVEKIENTYEWKPRCNEVDGKKDFFANNLCNNRFACSYKK